MASAIGEYEIWVGINRSTSKRNRAQQFQALLDAVSVLPFSSNEAAEAAEIRTELESAGTPIGPLDNLIAGTARANNAVLVTRNLEEFSRVPRLRVENWHQP